MLYNQSDIKRWFYHLPIQQNHQQYCALRVNGGVLVPNRAMMGLKNAPIYCHELGSTIFRGTAEVLQDDLHQGAASPKQALSNFVNLIDRAQQWNIKLNAKKTKIGFHKLEGIGRMLSGRGLSVAQRHRTKALRMNFSDLKTMQDIIVFYGLITYLTEYIPDLAERKLLLREEMVKRAPLPPTHDDRGKKLSTKQRNARHQLVRSDEARRIFESIQEKIENTYLLNHPNLKAHSKHRFLLIVDTSLKQCGAALWQQDSEQEPFELSTFPKEQDEQLRTKYKLIRLYSQALRPEETRYAATVREALGYKMAITKFKKFLIIKPFDLLGDCMPLKQLYNMHYDSPNQKLRRWVLILQTFSFRFLHRPGTKLLIVDFLSRLAIPTDNPSKMNKEELSMVVAVSDYINMATQQRQNPTLRMLHNHGCMDPSLCNTTSTDHSSKTESPISAQPTPTHPQSAQRRPTTKPMAIRSTEPSQKPFVLNAQRRAVDL